MQHLLILVASVAVALTALPAPATAQSDYGCLRTTGAKCCFPTVLWTGCTPCPADAIRPSSLYGCSGEKFNPASSRLMDWSFAGYMYGDYDLPTLPIMADIKLVFGAKGDGVADDTAAFELAIATIARRGTLLLPKGVYKITRRLDIDKQIFFQGEGANQTIMYFPKSMTEVYGNTWANNISQYAFGPGFINWNGGDFPGNTTRLAAVTANAVRGSREVVVDTVAGLQPGKVVRIVLDNVNGDLLRSLNGGLFPPFDPYTSRADVVRFTSKITDILATTPPRIRLERALPFDVSTTWRPEIHDWNNERFGVKRNFTGMADLTIRFPKTAPYAGESKEAGYNGVYMYHTGHSWIRNVIFENADIGIIMDGTSFNTVQNVTFISTRPASTLHPYFGGKGIWLKGAFDCLVRQFNFRSRFRYELVTSYFSIGNVFSEGTGVDMTMEFMYAAPYSNLFTNLQMGAATEPFGWTLRGQYVQDASSFNTFWNIRTGTDKLVLPPYTWAPRTNWIDTEAALPPTTGTPVQWYFETRTPVWPFNLWLAQRAARGRPLKVINPPRHSGPGYKCFTNGTKCCTTPTTGCIGCTVDARDTSKLFGCKGELWRAADRLGYEWSNAGYKEGKQSIPLLNVVVNLKTQFGAKGDGVTDDTAALLKALDSTAKGVIFLPAGTYVLKSVVNWRKPIVLRGEGRDKTKLLFPKSLTDLYNNTWVEGKWVGTSQYSHGTGFINIGGWDPTGRDFTKIAWVSAAANQGDRVLKIGCCSSSFAIGQMVRLWMRDPGDGSLMAELHGNRAPVAPEFYGFADPVRFLARVAAKGADWIKLDRTLPVRVNLAWKPEIHKFMPLIDGSTGIESLSVQFPFTPYPGHFLEQGWNGIHMNQVANGWIRDIRVENGDLGIYLWGTVFCTLENFELMSTPFQRGWFNGHRGVWLEHGSDNLMKSFKISTRFVHDISVSGTEFGSVIMDGNGFDLNLDHHRSAPYSNLFTNIDAGLGTRVFEASGDVSWGTHSARFSTFYNLRSRLNVLLPDADFGPLLTFIGVPTTDPSDPANEGWFVELLKGTPQPSNLWWGFKQTAAARLPA